MCGGKGGAKSQPKLIVGFGFNTKRRERTESEKGKGERGNRVLLM